MKKLVLRAVLNSLGTAVYIILVVSLIFSLQRYVEPKDTILAPIIMLMLLVCSAAITGFLVLGKPVMLYIDGKKKEAMSLLSCTIGILALLTVVLVMVLIIYF